MDALNGVEDAAIRLLTVAANAATALSTLQPSGVASAQEASSEFVAVVQGIKEDVQAAIDAAAARKTG